MSKLKLGNHISHQLNQELSEICNKVLVMGTLVEKQIALATQSFINGDTELAKFVIQQDAEVDALEMTLDQASTNILATRQTAAFDLKFILVVIKIIDELETIGDLAERIAKLALDLANAGARSTNNYELQHLSDLAQDILHTTLEIFSHLNLEAMPAIPEFSAAINREYDSLLRQLIIKMMETPDNIPYTLNILLAGRTLERIGIHGNYIGEHLRLLLRNEAL